MPEQLPGVAEVCEHLHQYSLSKKSIPNMDLGDNTVKPCHSAHYSALHAQPSRMATSCTEARKSELSSWSVLQDMMGACGPAIIHLMCLMTLAGI